ncbi:hypothetical protein ACF0H5_012453 [Mactra antiquata]
MSYATDNRPTSTHITPRPDRRLPKLQEKTSTLTIQKTSTLPVLPPPAAKPDKVEDDKRSKITVVSLKSNRTSRTVQTVESTLTPRTSDEPPSKGRKGVFLNAKNKVKDGFRQSSIKRIIASGLCIATTLLYLFGVFLPFWNVYTYSVNDVTTGYYGGLWNYCERTTGSGDTTCSIYTESNLDSWFRAVRGLELLAFIGCIALMILVVAYMFFLREVKYGYLQWFIIGLCFGTGLFNIIGLIVYGSCYSNSSHISSAYGLTFCAFFGSCACGALFLWDKINTMKKNHPDNATFRGLSGYQSSRARNIRSRLSHVKSTRSHRSQRSHDRSTIMSHAPSVPRSTRLGANASTVSHLPPTKEV